MIDFESGSAAQPEQSKEAPAAGNGRDGASPPPSDGGDGGRGGEDSGRKVPPEDEYDVGPSDQLVTIALANLVMVGGTAVSLWQGYPTSQLANMPPQFWAISGVIIVFGIAMAVGGQLVNGALRAMLRTSVERKISDRVLIPVVFLFTFATVWALYVGVKATGGASSPFTPFLTAPAVFAPIMAKRVKSMIFVGVVVVGAIWLSQHGDSFAKADEAVYSSVITAMVVIAIGIAAIRRYLGIDGHQPAKAGD